MSLFTHSSLSSYSPAATISLTLSASIMSCLPIGLPHFLGQGRHLRLSFCAYFLTHTGKEKALHKYLLNPDALDHVVFQATCTNPDHN